MASVYKYLQRPLEYNHLLLIVMLLIVFEVIPLKSFSTKDHIRKIKNTGEKVHSYGTPLKHFKIEHQGPEAKHHANITVLKAQTRSRTTLHCNISEVPYSENFTLSWSKTTKDSGFSPIITMEQVITEEIIGIKKALLNFSVDDKRFLVQQVKEDWCLHIRYILNSDSGTYKCQICHGFPSSKCSYTSVILNISDAHAKIIGGPRKFIPSDKELPLRLSCVLINSIEAPSYIFWYHEDRMINYDLEDGATVREGPQGSELIFPKPNKTHVGNYSCVPSNAQLASVTVYYGDEASVPLEDDSSGKKTYPDFVLNMLVLMSTVHLTR